MGELFLGTFKVHLEQVDDVLARLEEKRILINPNKSF